MLEPPRCRMELAPDDSEYLKLFPTISILLWESWGLSVFPDICVWVIATYDNLLDYQGWENEGFQLMAERLGCVEKQLLSSLSFTAVGIIKAKEDRVAIRDTVGRGCDGVGGILLKKEGIYVWCWRKEAFPNWREQKRVEAGIPFLANHPAQTKVNNWGDVEPHQLPQFHIECDSSVYFLHLFCAKKESDSKNENLSGWGSSHRARRQQHDRAHEPHHVRAVKCHGECFWARCKYEPFLSCIGNMQARHRGNSQISGVSLYNILGHVEEEDVNLHEVTANELPRNTNEFVFNRVLECSQ